MSRCVPAITLLFLSVALALSADDGDLDPSFWADGKMAVDATSDVTFGGLASDVNGQMAVACSYVPPVGVTKVGVWRSVGDVSVGGACEVEPYPTGMRNTEVVDVAFDATGRLIVLAREFYDAGVEEFEAWYALAYNFPDCVLDPGFSGDGIASLHGWDMQGLVVYHRLSPLADGTTLVTGGGLTGGPDGCRVHVISLEPNGGWGPTYCAPPDAFPVEAYGIDSAVAPNGHVVSIAGTDDFHIVDFMPDGTVSSVVTVPFNLGGANMDPPKAVAATPEGKVAVVGIAQLSGRFVMTDHAVAVLRWNGAGGLELDPTFSDDGKLAFNFSGWTWNGLEDVTAQGDGKIVVAGASKQIGADYAMLVARLLPDGSFDPDFYPAGSGVRTIEFDVGSPYEDYAYRVALQNGRVVVGGSVDIANDIASVGVARLLNSYVFADGFEAPQAPGWLWVE